MEEPLEGEEAGHRDGEDELAEWVHGRPTPLRNGEGGEDTETMMNRMMMKYIWGKKTKPNHFFFNLIYSP